MELKSVLKYIKEMSMPTVKSPEDAVKTIRDAYQTVVVKKQPQGDYYGPVEAALKFLRSTNAPEKYAQEVKKGIAALGAMKKYGASKSQHQAKFSSNR
jgi:hypothetical protein